MSASPAPACLRCGQKVGDPACTGGVMCPGDGLAADFSRQFCMPVGVSQNAGKKTHWLLIGGVAGGVLLVLILCVMMFLRH